MDSDILVGGASVAVAAVLLWWYARQERDQPTFPAV